MLDWLLPGQKKGGQKEESPSITLNGVRVPIAMDGVPGISQPPVVPGGDFAYDFVVPDAGLFWYHPHVMSAAQVGFGLYGALLVAALTNEPWQGAVTMGAFALGSALVLTVGPWLWLRLRADFDVSGFPRDAQVILRALKTYGAIVADKDTGLFAHPEKVHRLDHRGEFFYSRGPFTVPRSAQGHPVVIQAGQSGRGKKFAARWSECVFVNCASHHQAATTVADLRKEAARFGRDPSELLVLNLMFDLAELGGQA